MTIKKTPLYQCHLDTMGHMVEFAHTLLPVRYKSEKDEHEAVRQDVGLFDVSHMGEIKVSGTSAASFLQKLLSNNIEKLIDNQAQYTLLLNADGGIIDDLIVYRLKETEFLLCVNAANIEKDFHHIQSLAQKEPDLSITNVSDDYAQLALQGPKASSLLKELTHSELPQRFFIKQIEIAGISTLTARTGYTGEDGFEIFVAPTYAAKLWQTLLDKGASYSLKPCGLAARDSLRLFAGFLLCGQDMDETTTPLEAGLMFAVDLTKPGFLGKQALVKQKALGVPKKLMKFTMLDPGIARHNFAVYDQQNHKIGQVTSGTLIPKKSQAIGFAYIDAAYAHQGCEIGIDIRGRMAKAVLCKAWLI